MGTSGSSTRPSAWSSRRMSSAEKRAAKGARGLSRSVPTFLKPSRRSVAQVGADEPQGFDGKPRQRGGLLARRQDGAGRGVKPRQRPGGAGRCGDGKPRRQAEIIRQPPRKIGEERRFAAEQMGGAFDVEEKTVGAVLLVPRRGGRRIARRPQGQALERGVVGGRIDGARLQKTCFRPRIGQRLAGRKPRGFGRGVQRGDARSAAGGDSKNKRLFRDDRIFREGILRRPSRLRREKTQDRPARQPD